MAVKFSFQFFKWKTEHSMNMVQYVKRINHTVVCQFENIIWKKCTHNHASEHQWSWALVYEKLAGGPSTVRLEWVYSLQYCAPKDQDLFEQMTSERVMHASTTRQQLNCLHSVAYLHSCWRPFQTKSLFEATSHYAQYLLLTARKVPITPFL